MVQSASRYDRAVRTVIAGQRKTHPAHGEYTLKQLVGHFESMLTHYPDDPLLAGPYILDRLGTIRGHLADLERWATAIEACDPADAREYGARLLP